MKSSGQTFLLSLICCEIYFTLAFWREIFRTGHFTYASLFPTTRCGDGIVSFILNYKWRIHYNFIFKLRYPFLIHSFRPWNCLILFPKNSMNTQKNYSYSIIWRIKWTRKTLTLYCVNRESNNIRSRPIQPNWLLNSSIRQRLISSVQCTLYTLMWRCYRCVKKCTF